MRCKRHCVLQVASSPCRVRSKQLFATLILCPRPRRCPTPRNAYVLARQLLLETSQANSTEPREKTRRRARYEAWHDGSTGSSSLNPFANKRKASRLDHTLSASDEENGTLTKITTDATSDVGRGDSDGIVEAHIEKGSGGDLVRRDEATLLSDKTPIERVDVKASASETSQDAVVAEADAAEDEVKHNKDSDEKKSTQKFTVFSQLRAIFFNSWAHLLLLFIPAGFAVQYTYRSPVTVFCVNFVAMLPLIMVISLAVDEIGLRLGETLGGLVSTTFR